MNRIIINAVIVTVLTAATTAWAQNTVTFDNQSGQPALVKLVGPTSKEVAVPNGEKGRVEAVAGRYTIKVRYGMPGQYRYSKGEEFEVKETSTTRSGITITLHKVIDGNYGSKAISEAEFGGNADTNKPAISSSDVLRLVEDHLKALKTNDEADRQKAITAIQALVKSRAEIQNWLVQTRRMPAMKSDEDMKARNIALLISEIAVPSKDDVWRRILRDERIMSRESLESNITMIGFLISLGQVTGNAMEDFNTAMDGKEIHLTLDEIVKLYGKADTVSQQSGGGHGTCMDR